MVENMYAKFADLHRFGTEEKSDFKLTTSREIGVMTAPKIYNSLALIVILKPRDTMGQKECVI